jgi:hypothetical protein
MTLQRKVWVLLVVGASGLAACGSEDSSPPTATVEGPLPEGRFLTELQAALCDGLGRCCSDAGLPHNPEACRRYIAEQVRYNFPPQHRDRFEYDPVKAGECVALARRTTETCLSTSLFDILCFEAYAGKTQPGEVCIHHMECAVPPGGKASCDTLGGAEMQCRSQPRGAAGDRCNGNCTEGPEQTGCGGEIRYSDPVVANCYPTDGLYCDDGFCRRLVPLGESCDIYDVCELGAQCECEGASPCATSRCAPKRAIGDACVRDENCRDGLYCDQQSSTCQPRKPAGAPCDFAGYSQECRGYCDPRGCVDAVPFPQRMCDPGEF